MESVENNKKTIMSLSIIEWMKLDEIRKNESFPIKFNLNFSDYYIKPENNETIKIFGLQSSVFVKFIKRDATILDGRIIKDSNKNNIAKTITIDVGGNLKSDIILDKNEKLTFFSTNEKGETEELKTLFTYNPKTKKFSKE